MPSSDEPDPKNLALRSYGTLNPCPEQVRDEHFRDSDFFDPRDLVQVRYEMLRRVRVEGRPVSETAAGFGVSRPTYYKANKDFEADGLAGLVPRKRGPKGGHKLTAEVVGALQAALTEDPSLDAAALAELAHTRFGVLVHPRSVQRALVASKKK